MGAPWRPGDWAVPHPRGSYVDRMTGGRPGEVVRVDYNSLTVRYDFAEIIGYRDEWRRTERGHGRCVRCGEFPLSNDVAEVADGIVHVGCMKEGEQIA